MLSCLYFAAVGSLRKKKYLFLQLPRLQERQDVHFYVAKNFVPSVLKALEFQAKEEGTDLDYPQGEGWRL